VLKLVILVSVVIGVIRTIKKNKKETQIMENKNECSENSIVKEIVPYSNHAFIFGISSFLPFVGLILGIIGLVYANKGLSLYNECPQRYTSNSISILNRGKICSIIGIISSVLCVLCVLTLLYILAG
jgi:ABC-type Fe3+ transport system permease subunit